MYGGDFMKLVRYCGLIAVTCAACGPEVSARDVPASTVNGSEANKAASDSLPGLGGVPPAPARPVTALIPVVLSSDLDADVGARMSGVVRQVNVELADAVREGDVLLVLDDAREVARVESSTAALELARAAHARAEGLAAKGFITAAQMDEARYALRKAEAALREAQVELEHTRITAPFSGVITRRMTGRGRPVREGEPLFRLTALQPLRALLRVSEPAARRLRVGESAMLITEDGVQVAAVVQRISPATDPESGTVEVLLNVPRPGPLRPGSSASVRLQD
jgi:RND family efflux transporter MFP subunit